MHYLLALIWFVLALVGLDGYGSHSHVTRATVDGVDVLYSRTRVIADIADFTCVRSASGLCHYRLLARDCMAPRSRATTASACKPIPARQFALATGASREITGLPARFTLCVGQHGDAAGAECETLSVLDPLAMRR